MSMAMTPLRNLALAYFEGRLDFHSYRSQRAALLDGVPLETPGSDYDEYDITRPMFLDPDQPRTLPKSGDFLDSLVDTTATQPHSPEDETAPAPPPTPARSDSAEEPRKSFFMRRLMLVMIVALLGLVAVYHGKDLLNEGRQALFSESIPDAPVVAARKGILRGFLVDDEWTADRIGRFVVEWESLPVSLRRSAVASSDYAELLRVTSQRLGEQRALMDAGSWPEGEQQLALLKGFSEFLVRESDKSRAETP